MSDDSPLPWDSEDDVLLNGPYRDRDHFRQQLAELARLAKAAVDKWPRRCISCDKPATRPALPVGYQCDDDHDRLCNYYGELQEAAPLRALQAKLATLDGAAGGEASDKTSAMLATEGKPSPESGVDDDSRVARTEQAASTSSPGDAPKTGALFGGETSADEKDGGA